MQMVRPAISLVLVAVSTLAAGAAPPAAAQVPDTYEFTVSPSTAFRGDVVVITGSWALAGPTRDAATIAPRAFPAASREPPPTDTTDTTDTMPSETFDLFMVGSSDPIGWVTLRLESKEPPVVTIDGAATIPLDASDGPQTLTICESAGELAPRAVGPGFCPEGPVSVSPPTVTVDRAEAPVGASLAFSGRSWCCENDLGTVTEPTTGRTWAIPTIDGAGNLTAQAVVPDVPLGPVDLEVCVRDRCLTTGITIVEEEPPATDDPGTDPTSPDDDGGTSDAGSEASPPADAGSSPGEGNAPPPDGDPGAVLPGLPGLGGREISSTLPWLVGAAAGAAVMVISLRRLARRTPPRSGPRARVVLRPGGVTESIVGRDGPTVSISAVLDLVEGTTRLHERTLR